MPAQDRIGRDNRRNLAQHTSAQTLPAPRETAPLFVGYPHSSATKLTPQSSVLFDQIGDDILLLVIQSTRQRGEKHPDEGEVNHGASLH